LGYQTHASQGVVEKAVKKFDLSLLGLRPTGCGDGGIKRGANGEAIFKYTVGTIWALEICRYYQISKGIDELQLQTASGHLLLLMSNNKNSSLGRFSGGIHGNEWPGYFNRVPAPNK